MASSGEKAAAGGLSYLRYQPGDHKYRRWQEAIFEADHSHKCPTYVHRTPPCQGSCPAGEDIRGWLQIVRGIEKPAPGQTWQEYAFRRSTDANPFPAVMGRVCPAPCEDGCNRNQVDDFVGINAVEQFIGDHAIAQGLAFDAPPADTGKRVAIVGGGPAGLAAAFQLRRRGHAAVVFDDHKELGGMMRYGIPGYRTPREVLDAEIGRILALGVELRLNTRIGRDLSVEALEQEFDAIVWALGAQRGRRLPVEGFDAPNCITGVEFLAAFNEDRLKFVSQRVVVVGGGDTSIDVASVARRLGHIDAIHPKDRPEHVVLGYTSHDVATTVARQGAKVILTSQRPVEQMSAAEREVQDALREGVEIRGSVMPLAVLKDEDGLARAVRFAECERVKGKAVPKPGTEFEVECDLVVSAIGQIGNLDGLEPFDNGKGLIDCDAHYRIKDRPGHFVAGDIVRPHLLTTAIGQAAVAAESVDAWLRGSELTRRPKVDKHHFDLLNKLREQSLGPESYNQQQERGTDGRRFAVHNYENRSGAEIIPHERLFLGHFNRVAREIREEREVHGDAVIGDFGERIVSLTEERAIAEAKRCMSCGMCFECDNCVVYCPQLAVKRTPKKEATMGRYVYTDYDRCIGCHICADVCPTGYIEMGMGE